MFGLDFCHGFVFGLSIGPHQEFNSSQKRRFELGGVLKQQDVGAFYDGIQE